jgi:hypothetical protein
MIYINILLLQTPGMDFVNSGQHLVDDQLHP